MRSRSLLFVVLAAASAWQCATHVPSIAPCQTEYSAAQPVLQLEEPVFVSNPHAHRVGSNAVASGHSRFVALEPLGGPPVEGDVAFLDLTLLRSVPAGAMGRMIAPVAFTSADGSVHVLWGVAREDADDHSPLDVARVMYARYRAGAWHDSVTVAAGELWWGWVQSSSVLGSRWAIAAPVPGPAPHVVVIDSDGSAVRVRTVEIPGRSSVATSTLVTPDDDLIVAVLTQPPDEHGRLSAYTFRSVQNGDFSPPERVPDALLRGFGAFRLVGRSASRFTLLWVEFGGSSRRTVERADFADGSWQRLPGFDTGHEIQGPLHAAVDACDAVHVAFATGGDNSLVLAGPFDAGPDGLVRRQPGRASANPFFIDQADGLALYWFTLELGDGLLHTSIWRSMVTGVPGTRDPQD